MQATRLAAEAGNDLFCSRRGTNQGPLSGSLRECRKPGGQAGGPAGGPGGWGRRAGSDGRSGRGGRSGRPGRDARPGRTRSCRGPSIGRLSTEARERTVTPASRGLTSECIQLLERAGSTTGGLQPRAASVGSRDPLACPTSKKTLSASYPSHLQQNGIAIPCCASI